ncbi:hypothetical protein AAMO2058_001391400 [Amorphochlora amoebiformis]
MVARCGGRRAGLYAGCMAIASICGLVLLKISQNHPVQTGVRPQRIAFQPSVRHVCTWSPKTKITQNTPFRHLRSIIVRSDLGDEEFEPMDIDSSFIDKDVMDPELVADDDEEIELGQDLDQDVDEGDVIEALADEIGAATDEEWYKSLSQSFAVDQEASLSTIQKDNDPSTDTFVALTESHSIEDAKTSEIDDALADITKEIKELKVELSDSEEEFDEDDGKDDSDDDFRNWPIDPFTANHPPFKPPRPDELPKRSIRYYYADPDDMEESNIDPYISM